MKYGVMAAVVLAVAGWVSASPIGVYVDDSFDAATLDSANWTTHGSVTLGQKLHSTGNETHMTAPGYVLIDGWNDAAELIGVDMVHPDAGQTVILTTSGLTANEWGAGTSWGLLGGAMVSVGNWQEQHVHNCAIQIAGKKCSNILNNASLDSDFVLTWTPTRITLSSTASGMIFDTDVNTPDGGGSWVIPTTDAKFYAFNYLQGGISFGGTKLEVVPEPVTLALLAMGSGLMLRRRV